MPFAGSCSACSAYSFLSGLALAIVLHIRHNHIDTTVEVPEGIGVKIAADGRVVVKLPDEAVQGKQNSAAVAQPDEKAIQGTWEVLDCSTGATTGMGYSPLMAIYPMFLNGQPLTISRQRWGLMVRPARTVWPRRVSG